jgi:hypothetical protein
MIADGSSVASISEFGLVLALAGPGSQDVPDKWLRTLEWPGGLEESNA